MPPIAGVVPDLRVAALFHGMRAEANAVTPTLRIELALQATPSGDANISLPDIANSDISVQHVAAHVWISQAASGMPEQWFVGTAQSAPGTYINRIRHGSEADTFEVLLPLTREALQRIEDVRAGKSAYFSIRLAFNGLIHMRENGKESITSYSIRSTPVDRPGRRHSRGSVEIAQSDWLEILDGVRFANYRVFELAAHPDGSAVKADEFLDKARKQFALGHWKESLAESRSTLESLRDDVHVVRASVLKDRKQDADEKLAAFWKAWDEFTESYLRIDGAARGLLSAGSHAPREGAVGPAEAELGLTVALAFRQYVGRRWAVMAARGPG